MSDTRTAPIAPIYLFLYARTHYPDIPETCAIGTDAGQAAMSAARHLRIAPAPEDVLRAEIRQTCSMIDRRLGSPEGTAERGTYYWHWPPEDITDPDVLARLHADAITYLFAIVNPEGETP